MHRVHPNTLTTTALLMAIVSGVALASGRLRLGGLFLLASGFFDLLDGRVARRSGKSTRFGAFYDSMLDRIGESVLYTGIAVFFLRGGVSAGLITVATTITFATLAASLLVSYARARAEGLGMDCKVGIANRAERIVVLGIPCLLFGSGPHGLILLGVVALIGLSSLVTVAQRMIHVSHIAD